MNKKLIITVSLSAILLISGCGNAKITDSNPEGRVMAPEDQVVIVDDVKPGSAPQGIRVNQVLFEVLTDNIPEELNKLIEENKASKGYIVRQIDNEYYVMVFMGEQTTGGYAVEVGYIEDSEGKTLVVVNETKPDKDAMVTMVMTYPYQVIKIKSGVAPDFTVVNQENEVYPEIN